MYNIQEKDLPKGAKESKRIWRLEDKKLRLDKEKRDSLRMDDEKRTEDGQKREVLSRLGGKVNNNRAFTEQVLYKKQNFSRAFQQIKQSLSACFSPTCSFAFKTPKNFNIQQHG